MLKWLRRWWQEPLEPSTVELMRGVVDVRKTNDGGTQTRKAHKPLTAAERGRLREAARSEAGSVLSFSPVRVSQAWAHPESLARGKPRAT